MNKFRFLNKGIKTNLIESILLSIIICFIAQLFFLYLNLFQYTKYLSFLLIVIFIYFFRKYTSHSTEIKIKLIILLLIISFFTAFFTTKDINAGRDNGAYLNDSLLINKSNTYIYQDAVLATFPGFTNLEDGETVLGFPIGYSLFLTLFHLGKMSFLFLANFILYFFILYCVYKISSVLFERANPLYSVIFFSTFYTSIWITRNFYSENLTCFLLLGALTLLLSNNKNIKLLSAIPAVATLLVRLDTLIYLPIFLVIYFIEIKRIKGRIEKKLVLFLFLALAIVFFAFYFYSVSINDEYLINHFKEFVSPIKNLFFEDNTTGITDFTNLHFPMGYYTLKVFSAYLLPVFFALAVFGLFRILRNRHRNTRYIIYTLLFFAPSLFFIFKPMITIDHPWFMRRFYPAFIPLLIILAVSFFEKKLKKGDYIIIILLVIGNLVNVAPILFFRDYRDSPVMAEQLADSLPDDSVLIVASGSQNTLSTYMYINYDIISSIEPAYWSWLDRKYPNDLLTKQYILDNFAENKEIFVLSKVNPSLEKGTSISNVFTNDELVYLKEYQYTTPAIKYSCDFRAEFLNQQANKEMIDQTCDDLPPTEISQKVINFYIYQYQPS
ncbi:MAG: hypothetical protein ABIB97_00765 [Patescibacteria group bacterium]